jgi:hypothetical protein
VTGAVASCAAPPAVRVPYETRTALTAIFGAETTVALALSVLTFTVTGAELTLGLRARRLRTVCTFITVLTFAHADTPLILSINGCVDLVDDGTLRGAL